MPDLREARRTLQDDKFIASKRESTMNDSPPEIPFDTYLRTTLPTASDRLRVGGLLVSPICISSVATPQIIEEAFTAGINFFLLSGDLHWRDYEASREGLRKLLSESSTIRSQLVVAGVSWVGRSDFANAPFREIVESVPGLGHLDMTIIGGAEDSTFIPRLHVHMTHGANFGTKAVGAAVANDDTAVWTANRRLVDLLVVPYGAGKRRALETILPLLEETSAPIFTLGSSLSYVHAELCASRGFPAGKWIPSRADYTRFVLSDKRIGGAIVPILSSEDLAELVDSLKDGGLNQNDLNYMADLVDVALGRAALA